MPFTPSENQTTDVTDDEVDALMSKYGNDADGPTPSDPIEGEQVAPEVATVAAPVVPVAPPKEQEYEYNYKGRLIKEPLSMILKRASQGYDYAQTMNEVKQQREQAQEMASNYEPIDTWVRDNPDKWEKLQSVIQAEKDGYGDLPADHPLLQRLTKFEGVIDKYEKKLKAEETSKEDNALDTEIKSIQEKYKDLDWVSVGDNGRAREQNVLSHANLHGFKTFKAAFLDLYHDDLIKGAETRAREQFAAQKEKQSKTGLLSAKLSAPKIGDGLTKPTKQTKSYPSTEEILTELGIS